MLREERREDLAAAVVWIQHGGVALSRYVRACVCGLGGEGGEIDWDGEKTATGPDG